MTHGLQLGVYSWADCKHDHTCCDVKEDLVHLRRCLLLHVLPILHAFECVFHHFFNNASLGDTIHSVRLSPFSINGCKAMGRMKVIVTAVVVSCSYSSSSSSNRNSSTVHIIFCHNILCALKLNSNAEAINIIEFLSRKSLSAFDWVPLTNLVQPCTSTTNVCGADLTFIISFERSLIVAWISGILTRLCMAFMTSVLFWRAPATRTTARITWTDVRRSYSYMFKKVNRNKSQQCEAHKTSPNKTWPYVTQIDVSTRLPSWFFMPSTTEFIWALEA